MRNTGRWCLGGSMVLTMVALLAACGDGSDRQPTGGVSPSGAEPSLTADRTVTLKVTGMKKSGGGST